MSEGITRADTPLESLQQEIDDLQLHFYITAGVLSCVLFFTIVLCIILYYWVYTIEQKFLNPEEYQNFKIRRAHLRDPFPNRASQNDYRDFRNSSQPAQNFQQDQRNFKNPLGTSPTNYNEPQRPRNSAVIDELRRNPRNTEQQLHQNFYGVDNGNFRY